MDGFHRSWKTWYQTTRKRTFPCSGVQTSLIKWLRGCQANVLYLCLYSFKVHRFLSTVGFSNEDSFCQSQRIGKLIKEKPWKNVRQLAPKTISPGRFALSLWTICPQFLDDSPPVSGQFAPSFWTIRPQSLDKIFALKKLIKEQQRSSSILHNLQQLSKENFYKPLSSPIVQNTARKAKELVNKLYRSVYNRPKIGGESSRDWGRIIWGELSLGRVVQIPLEKVFSKLINVMLPQIPRFSSSLLLTSANKRQT